VPVEIIVFNDLHLADKPPIGRREGYREEGLAMLREIVQFAMQREALLLTTGDLFHKKTPQHNSHALVREVIEILSPLTDSGVGRLLVVPGNHDVTYRGLESLPNQPLGVLHEAGLVHILDSWYRPEPDILITGRPYHIQRDADASYYELTTEERKYAEQSRLVLLAAHGSIIPDHEYRPYPTVRVSEIDTTGISILVSGHIHEDLGKSNLRTPGMFWNGGSLGRVARTEANRTRTLKALSIDVGTKVSIEEITLKSAFPADNIFVDVEEGVKSEEITEFVAQLTQGFEFETIGDLDATMAEMGVPDDIASVVRHYLQEAGL